MAQTLPKVSTSSRKRLGDVPSKFVAPRHVDVWLPPGYNSDAGYNLIYIHDRQMRFDAQITCNELAGQVDVTLARLIKEGRIPPSIVVGIWSNDKTRHAEYFAQKQLDFLPSASRDELISRGLQGKPLAEAYWRFLVEELKPAVDQKYATNPDAAQTFVSGSSMVDGLISVYATREYPQVFGGAQGLPTHWIGSRQANATPALAAFNYLRDHLAAPEGRRLYQDHGTIELDALYTPYQALVDEVVRELGYTPAKLMSRTFDNEGHNTMAWAKRMDIPFEFLLGRGVCHD